MLLQYWLSFYNLFSSFIFVCMKAISGKNALATMRMLRRDPEAWFSMQHLTYDSGTGNTNGLRTVTRCALRPALRTDTFKKHGDMYLPYTDLEKQEPRACFRKLIRAVAFPPDYEWKKVFWFKNNMR